MRHPILRPQRPRWPLLSAGTLELLVGGSAVAAGLFFVRDPSGAGVFPLSMLEQSPFRDYLIPGLVLLIVVGLGNVAAAALSFTRHRLAAPAAIAMGVVTCGWIVCQVAFIGYVSFLQPAVFIIGLVIAALGWRATNAGRPRIDDRSTHHPARSH